MRRRVFDALDRLVANDLQGEVIRLKGVEHAEYRLRVGEYRVRFSKNIEANRIDVLRVLPRGAAYKR